MADAARLFAAQRGLTDQTGIDGTLAEIGPGA